MEVRMYALTCKQRCYLLLQWIVVVGYNQNAKYFHCGVEFVWTPDPSGYIRKGNLARSVLSTGMLPLVLVAERMPC